jgi:hypothetical protein
MNAHTPTPWFIVANHTKDQYEFVGGKDQCLLAGHSSHQPDAQHIVRCVNAHDDLIAALQDIAQQTCPPDSIGYAMAQKARAALAKVSA